MVNILEVKNLTKKFNGFTAVDGINFCVGAKEVFAFLGPNGAGKTTTIKMLTTLLEPTSGEGLVNSYNILTDAAAVRRCIGYVPQMLSVDGALTAYENLMLMAKLYDIPRKERQARVKDTLEFLDLAKFAKAQVKTFSGGMIRKLEIGQAMLHRPCVLFLDEPTTGLDPVAKQNVWEHILALREEFGTTIFFSTHYMEEAEDVCDKVAIMNAGKIAVIGSAQELISKTGLADATLADAFIFFTGNNLQENGNWREIRRARAVMNKRR